MHIIEMIKSIAAAALGAAMIGGPVMAADTTVDPGFGQREPLIERRGINPIARILFAPLLPFVELQSSLSPEKASCYNDLAGEVAGCNIVEVIEEHQAARPTPY